MKDPNEEVERTTLPTTASDLTEEKAHMFEKEEWIKLLPMVFRQCECYLREYEADEGRAINLLQAMHMVGTVIKDARKDLIERHKLPDFPVT